MLSSGAVPKTSTQVDLDPSAGDVGFVLCCGVWICEHSMFVILRDAGVCSPHRKPGDLSSVPTLTASFQSSVLVTVFIWNPSTFFRITG